MEVASKICVWLCWRTRPPSQEDGMHAGGLSVALPCAHVSDTRIDLRAANGSLSGARASVAGGRRWQRSGAGALGWRLRWGAGEDRGMQTNHGGRLDQGDHLSISVISLTVERKPHLRHFPPDDNASCRSRCVAPTAAQCRCCSRCLATLSVPISRGELGVLPPLLASSWRTRQGPASSGRVGLDWAMLFSCATTAGLAGMLAGTSTSKAIPELGGLWRSALSDDKCRHQKQGSQSLGADTAMGSGKTGQ